MRHRALCAGATLGAAIVILGTGARGHTPIASRWTYNEHLFPIFRERCGACHIEGGVAPFSLVDYQSAYPWSQSIREEVLALRMPPWRAEDGFGDFRNGHALPAHEMDMILEWSSGGYPQGPLDKRPPAVPLTDQWALGAPDLTLQVPAEFTLGAGTREAVRFFVMASGADRDRWVRGVDFQPGSRPVVRSAVVYFDSTGTARALDALDPAPGFAPPADGSFPAVQPVAIWNPAQRMVPFGDGRGYPLSRNADVVVRVHYKKTWITEGQAFTDRSTVALYFAEGATRPIESLVISSPALAVGRQLTFQHRLEEDLDVLALLPEVEIEASALRIEAVRPDGSRAPLLLLHEPDPNWPTRFWFERPISLPRGSQIEVRAALKPGAEPLKTAPLLGSKTGGAPVRFLMDFVSGGQAN